MWYIYFRWGNCAMAFKLADEQPTQHFLTECHFPPMLENIPDVEENVPLPASATEAMPELSPKEELDMMARTAKMLSDITGEPLAPTEEHRGQAIQLAEQIVANKTDMNLAQYPNETIAYLAGMVAQYDFMVVRELADLKKYVVNKLLQETDNPDPKYRLAAVKALGEVDGVDAFKKRSELTIKHQSLEEVENELLATLQRLEKRTVDVHARVVSNENNA